MGTPRARGPRFGRATPRRAPSARRTSWAGAAPGQPVSTGWTSATTARRPTRRTSSMRPVSVSAPVRSATVVMRVVRQSVGRPASTRDWLAWCDAKNSRLQLPAGGMLQHWPLWVAAIRRVSLVYARPQERSLAGAECQYWCPSASSSKTGRCERVWILDALRYHLDVCTRRTDCPSDRTQSTDRNPSSAVRMGEGNQPSSAQRRLS